MKKNSGVSLVEVMIALVVLLLVFLAMMQTALVSIESNTANTIRDEAVSIGDQAITFLRSRPFANADLGNTAATTVTAVNCPNTITANINLCNRISTEFQGGAFEIQRGIRNIPQRFCVYKCIADLGTDNKQVDVTVRWRWKGDAFSHTTSTLIRSTP